MTKKVNEISLGDYRKKAGMQKAQAGMGAMFAPSPEQRAKELATFNKREKGLNRLKARDEKARQAAIAKQQADDIANLPYLKAEYEKMQAKYKALGGSDWQYADREQNLTDREREARSMEGPMNNLWRQISAAEKAQKQQGVAEGNSEYDDEAGMADNNLETLRRTIDGIDGLIKPGDNLPEWCQEKVAVAKSMLVAVWDYMQSEQERGAMESQTNEWKKSTKAPIRPRNPVAKNASAGIGGGAAGAHKSKKKELPRKEKHKKKPELAESATYDRRLNLILEMKLLKEQFKDLKK